MPTNHNEILPECAQTQAHLADYTENTLSARGVWAVEKHLAHCTNCARLSREMQATVVLLKSAARRDTSDDFMARLHARIDTLEPAALRSPSFASVLRDWGATIGNALRSPRVPALSLGVAATALLAILVVPRLTQPDTVSSLNSGKPHSVVTQIAAEPLRRHAALAANNPFDDPVAATLEASADASEGENSVQ